MKVILARIMAKKESSDEEAFRPRSEDEEYAMAVRDFKKFFKKRQGVIHETTTERQKDVPKKTVDDRTTKSDSDEKDDEMAKDEKCLVAQASDEVFGSYFQNSKAYIILNKHTRKIEESLNVTFDKTPPPSKTSPLVDDDLDEEEAIKVYRRKRKT
ncbi:hypothetical protein Tco_0968665 [Tanacetum coccineum]